MKILKTNETYVAIDGWTDKFKIGDECLYLGYDDNVIKYGLLDLIIDNYTNNDTNCHYFYNKTSKKYITLSYNITVNFNLKSCFGVIDTRNTKILETIENAYFKIIGILLQNQNHDENIIDESYNLAIKSVYKLLG